MIAAAPTRSRSPGQACPASTTFWLQIAALRGPAARHYRRLREALPDPARLRSLLLDGIEPPALRSADLFCAEMLRAAIDACSSAGRSTDCGAVHRTGSARRAVQDALAWQAKSATHHLLGMDHPDYPASLLNTADAPPVLYVQGQPGLLADPNVALIGSRKASHAALELTEQLAGELAAAGLGIVSGLALGIDGAAHRGALRVAGPTIAVLATAIDKTYPKRHADLSREIAEHGALVSERALGSELHQGCFPRRNRLISGLSAGVVVVEAALPSGSMITARHALEQGREVMAMPGAVQNRQSRGCHELIRHGASLVENGSDVLAVLASTLSKHPRRCDRLEPSSTGPCVNNSPLAGELDNNKFNAQALTNNPDGRTLLACIGFDQASVDTLIKRSGLSVAEVTTALSLLEIHGLVTVEPGGRYARVARKG